MLISAVIKVVSVLFYSPPSAHFLIPLFSSLHGHQRPKFAAAILPPAAVWLKFFHKSPPTAATHIRQQLCECSPSKVCQKTFLFAYHAKYELAGTYLYAPEFAFLICRAQSESPYSSVTAGSGASAAHSVSDKVSRSWFPEFVLNVTRSIPYLPTLLRGAQIYRSLTRKTTTGYITPTLAGIGKTMQAVAF